MAVEKKRETTKDKDKNKDTIKNKKKWLHKQWDSSSSSKEEEEEELYAPEIKRRKLLKL